MHSLNKLLSTFSSDNHTRGVQFEKLCKWLLENHPMYKSKLVKVWLWDDWPHRWGRDCGIDLVAEDADGNTWAIQAKCYDQKYSVTKQDIDSFLSESTNTKIQQRLLIATTDGLGANAVSVIKRQHDSVPINQLMLSDLLEAPIEWPVSIDNLSTGSVKKAFTPKPYQQTAIDNVVNNLDARGQLIMACGTGKTLTGLWITEELKSETVLILLPSLLLLSKTLSEWLTHAKEPFSFLPVCSDDTVAKSEDAIALSTSELSFPSTTKAGSIAKFLKSRGRKVIFSTYQSSEKIAEAFELEDLKPLDLVIADEAHRCAGKVGSAQSTVLHNHLIPANKRLFMTATPRVYQGFIKKRASESGVEVVSMDDTKTFGPVLHKLSFGEAIEQDLLTDYQVAIVGIDNPFYLDMIKERRLVQTENDMQSDAETFASHVGLAKAIKRFDLKRVISFHSRVSAAKDFADKLPEVLNWIPITEKASGELLTGYVSGAMPTNQRTKNLQALGDVEPNQRYVLSNARCLSEGVDVPALDGVAFIDPRNSEIDIIQAVGRAIRLSKGKSKGTIVIPVFIRDGEDPDETLNSSAFKKVWSVVNALRSHDEGLGEELDQLRLSLGKRGTVGHVEKIIFDLPTTIAEGFQEALDIKLIESSTDSWEFWFGLLEQYKGEFGDCLVPQRYKEKGFNLGAWVGNQRVRKDKLSKERLERLNAIGFVWDPKQEVWDSAFKLLTEYKEEFGDVRVRNDYKIKSVALGAWVCTQRSYKSRLSEERIERLNSIGFVWDSLHDVWESSFKLLTEYKEEFGNCLVPHKYTAKGVDLYNWSNSQIAGKDKLSEERIERLNTIGFVWDRNQLAWENGFQLLTEYKEEFGDYLVPGKYKTKGYALGMWVSHQRTKKAQLSEERLERLNGIGFVWDTLHDAWESSFKLLTEYKEEFGNCLVPKGGVLGSWVGRQRAEKDQLSEERLERLNAVGFVWDPHQEAWKSAFNLLTDYKEEFGNCLVPYRYTAKGVALGTWVSSQRRAKDQLSEERLERLNGIGFVWDPKQEVWDSAFKLLIEYKEEFDDCLVPIQHESKNFSLGTWVTSQRKAKDQLSEERLERLNAVGFVWDVYQEAWDSAFKLLTEYKGEFGDCRVPQGYKAKGVGLGAWVHRQRRAKDQLSEERLERLDAIGFVWRSE